MAAFKQTPLDVFFSLLSLSLSLSPPPLLPRSLLVNSGFNEERGVTLGNFYAKKNYDNIVVTGHSMGAAVSNLVIWDLLHAKASGALKAKIHHRSFAGPRVFFNNGPHRIPAKPSTEIIKAFNAIDSKRIVGEGDVVPATPFSAVSFHVGELYLLGGEECGVDTQTHRDGGNIFKCSVEKRELKPVRECPEEVRNSGLMDTAAFKKVEAVIRARVESAALLEMDTTALLEMDRVVWRRGGGGGGNDRAAEREKREKERERKKEEKRAARKAKADRLRKAAADKAAKVKALATRAFAMANKCTWTRPVKKDRFGHPFCKGFGHDGHETRVKFFKVVDDSKIKCHLLDAKATFKYPDGTLLYNYPESTASTLAKFMLRAGCLDYHVIPTHMARMRNLVEGGRFEATVPSSNAKKVPRNTTGCLLQPRGNKVACATTSTSPRNKGHFVLSVAGKAAKAASLAAERAKTDADKAALVFSEALRAEETNRRATRHHASESSDAQTIADRAAAGDTTAKELDNLELQKAAMDTADAQGDKDTADAKKAEINQGAAVRKVTKAKKVSQVAAKAALAAENVATQARLAATAAVAVATAARLAATAAKEAATQAKLAEAKTSATTTLR